VNKPISKKTTKPVTPAARRPSAQHWTDRVLTRQDLVDMERFGFDPNNLADRERWAKYAG